MNPVPQTTASTSGSEDAKGARHLHRIIRRGAWHSDTSELVSDHVQGNVAILPVSRRALLILRAAICSDAITLLWYLSCALILNVLDEERG